MKQLLFTTQNDLTGFVLRTVLALIMVPHGAQKLFGWFGGFGYKGSMEYFTNTMNLPWIISFLVIFIEFFGALALLVGFTSRLWAIGFIAIMIGAIYTTNFKNGLFMNWFGNQQGEGYEYHLLVIGICIALLFTGSGKFSVDEVIHNQIK